MSGLADRFAPYTGHQLRIYSETNYGRGICTGSSVACLLSEQRKDLAKQTKLKGSCVGAGKAFRSFCCKVFANLSANGAR